MKIYISGPISGQREEAEKLFSFIEGNIKLAGHVPVNPFKLHGGKKNTWEQNLKEDIAELIWCDAIYLLPGWKSSRGARLEAHIAQELRLKIMNHTEKNSPDQLSLL